MGQGIVVVVVVVVVVVRITATPHCVVSSQQAGTIDVAASWWIFDWRHL
jgi:hypothetical protein